MTDHPLSYLKIRRSEQYDHSYSSDTECCSVVCSLGLSEHSLLYHRILLVHGIGGETDSSNKVSTDYMHRGGDNNRWISS